MDDLETDRCTCKTCRPDPLWRPTDAFHERAPDPSLPPYLMTVSAYTNLCLFCGSTRSVKTATVGGQEAAIIGSLLIILTDHSGDEVPS